LILRFFHKKFFVSPCVCPLVIFSAHGKLSPWGFGLFLVTLAGRGKCSFAAFLKYPRALSLTVFEPFFPFLAFYFLPPPFFSPEGTLFFSFFFFRSFSFGMAWLLHPPFPNRPSPHSHCSFPGLARSPVFSLFQSVLT